MSTTHVLVFQIGRHLLSLRMESISEIFVLSQVTRVPVAPVFMRHVVSFRGMVLPVVDLSPFLGETIQASVTYKTAVAVHGETPEPRFAMVMDSVVSIAGGHPAEGSSPELPFFVDTMMALPKGVSAWNISPARIENFILGQLAFTQRNFGVSHDKQQARSK